MKTDVKKLENAQVEISVQLPADAIEKHRLVVEEEALKNVEVDGFRKGHAPRDIAMKKIEPLRLYEEMAQRAISENYVAILEETKVEAIGQPQIMITKIAEGSDLEFKIITAVMPKIQLADYKKIAAEVAKNNEKVEASDEEVAEAINNIRRIRAQQLMAEQAPEGEAPTSWNDIKDEDLPELNDEFVQSVGAFKDVEDFKKKMKENVQADKEAKELEKKRIAIIDGILADSEIEVPQMMIDYEVDKMLHEFEGNIVMTGMSFDDYLNSIKKTRDDYRKEWQEQGKKRAQTQLMLTHIAKQEKIDADDESIEKEVSAIMEQYKDQNGIDENNVRAYVAQVLTHQKVFEFLEAQK